jgi:hypothetical protein
MEEKYTDPKPFTLSLGNCPVTGNVDNLPSSEFMLLQQVRIQIAGLRSGLEQLKIKQDEAVEALNENMARLNDSVKRIAPYLEAEERRRSRPWWRRFLA